MNKKERDIVNKVYTRFDEMKKRRNDESMNWSTWEDDYNMAKPVYDDNRSDYVAPLTFSIIETIKTETTDQRVRFKVIAEDIDNEENEEKINRAIEHVFSQNGEGLELMKKDHEVYLYGTGVMKVYIHRDVRDVEHLVSIKTDKNGKEIKTFKKGKDVKFDGVKFENIPIEKIYFDDASVSIENSNDIIERNIYTVEEAKEKFKNYKNVEEIKAGGDTEEEEERQYAIDLVEVLEYWSITPDRHIVVANGILIIDEPNPYAHKMLPYSVGYDYIRPKSIYGKGEAEILHSLQTAYSEMMRSIIDNLRLSTNNMFVTDHNFKGNELYTQPNKLIKIERGERFDQVQITPVVREAYAQLESIRKDSEDTTGVNRQLLGAQASSQATLGEIQLLKESALKRIRQKLRLSESNDMLRFGKLLVATIQQRYKYPILKEEDGKLKEVKLEVLMNDEGEKTKRTTIEGDEMKGTMGVRVVPGSTLPMSRGARLNSILKVLPELKDGMQEVDQSGNKIEPIFNKQEVYAQLIKEADLPITLFTKDVAKDGFDENDITEAIDTAKPTETELKGQLEQKMGAMNIANEMGAKIEGEQAVMPDLEDDTGEIQSADEVTSPDIAGAEDHADRILSGEEPEINEGLITPRHIEIHKRDLETQPFADETANAMLKQHISDEEEVLDNSLEELKNL